MIKYLLAGACYGMIRKTIDVSTNNPQIHVSHKHDGKQEVVVNRDMLVTEKIITVVLHTTLSSAYWPYYLTTDLITLEGRHKRVFEKQESPSSYIYNEVLFHAIF